MKNYYEEIIEKIQYEIENRNFEEALKLIKEEMQAPYIPYDFEKELENLSKELLENMQNDEIEIDKWSFEKILKVINQLEDQELHLMAFDALRTKNARKILYELKKYLINTNINSVNKTFLLFVLIEQSINEDFSINKNGETFLFNPATYDLINSQEILKEIELKLENIIYNSNPSLFSISMHIANNYFYHTFPNLNFKTKTLNDLCLAVLMKASLALGIEFDKTLESKISFNKENTMILLNELNSII